MNFEVDGVAIAVFCALFLLVTVLGFVAARWKRGDLAQLDEWGLGGRRFGTVITWFLWAATCSRPTPSSRCRLWYGPSVPAGSSRCRTRSWSSRWPSW
jgi:hypothetical protein